MGTRGPTPMPIEQKRLLGNPGKRDLTTLTVVEPLDTTMVSQSPLAALKRVMEAGVAWLADTDAPAVALLYSMLEDREAFTRSGLRDDKLDKQIMELFAALGFTPGARSRLGLAEVKAVSKLEQLRQARKNEGVA